MTKHKNQLTDTDCRKRAAILAANLPAHLPDALRILQYATDITRFMSGQTEAIEETTPEIPVNLEGRNG